MKAETKTALEHFAHLDTWSSGHPSDSERFCEFVSTAYRNGDYHLDRDEFMGVFGNLNEHLAPRAEKFLFRFDDGIELLRNFHKA